MIEAPVSTLLADGPIAAAGDVLAQACCNDPLCVYTEPVQDARLGQFAWLFSQLVRDGSLQGGVYTYTSGGRLDGVAVWMPCEGGEPTAEAGVWSEMGQMEQNFGPEAARRFTKTYRSFEHIHSLWMPSPHWYLALLGVAPARQRQGIGGALLRPVLERADQAGLPCYLETFVFDNVPFYQRHGFRVVQVGIELQSQVRYWAMKRGADASR